MTNETLLKAVYKDYHDFQDWDGPDGDYHCMLFCGYIHDVVPQNYPEQMLMDLYTLAYKLVDDCKTEDCFVKCILEAVHA